MIFQRGLVFYDLEWTGPELLQIGAVCLDHSFEQTILTKTDIHPKVSATIMLQTRLRPVKINGQWVTRREVYDLKKEAFLSTCTSREALGQFLNWLKSIRDKFGQSILISHGSVDIPILYQNFAKHDMEEEFLRSCSHFLDFQEYLKSVFPGLPLGLPALVQQLCDDKVYRLHSAMEDALATRQVFLKLHQMKSDWQENTELVITNDEKFGSEFAPFKRIRLRFINYEKECKEMKFLYIQINPEAIPQIVEDTSEWPTILSHLSLFQKVDPPPCHMFSVGGWVIRHHLVEGGRVASTRIDLLCYLGNSYFKCDFYPDSKATFMKKKLLLNLPSVDAVPVGTPVIVKLKMKVGQVIRVMYIKELDNEGNVGTLEDAIIKLNNASDKQWVL